MQFKTLIGCVRSKDMLDPEKIEHKNRRFEEDEVKSLCDTFRLKTKELILRLAGKKHF